jgi:transcriptional regulator with XRE-family HTH domain
VESGVTEELSSLSPNNDKPEQEEAAVCKRLRELRREHRLTLDTLAERSGFTKGYLSKIENGNKAPPIGTLARIARAMGVDLSVFFVDPDQDNPTMPLSQDSPVSVVHSWERKPVSRGGSEYGYDYVSLAHKKANRNMDPFMFTFPQHTDPQVFFEHAGEEFVYLLTGTVEFEFKIHGQLAKVRLEAGDSMYFESNTPHRGRALDGDAQALVVIIEPPSEE